MLITGWSSIYITALVLGVGASSSRNKDLNYYDGSQGRMDRSYYTHDEFPLSHNRPKRNPHSPNVWAKSSESQGVSCPTRLRENSLDTLGDSDRSKDVVHIPCPKRKTAGAKVVACFKGKPVKANASNRRARELLKKNPRGDLNEAVKQNAQWLILSSQDRVQTPNQGYIGPNVNSSYDPTSQNWNMNQPSPSSHQRLSSERAAMWRNPKGAKEDYRKTQFSKSFQLAPQNGANQSNTNVQASQSNFYNPQIPRLKEPFMQDKAAQSVAPNHGYYSIAPPRNVPSQAQQEVPIQNPNLRKDKNPYEANRFLMNSYNMTYDGPHHSGSPSQPNVKPANPPGAGNGMKPVNPLGAVYPNIPNQMNPSFFQSHATAVNSIPLNTYLAVYNATVASEGPRVFYNTNETRNGPWVPGAVEVDIPPGYPHQPTLPPKTTKSFDAVNFKDLPKAGIKNIQPSVPKFDDQRVHQNQPNETPQTDSWRLSDGSYSYNQYQQNMARPEPVGSYGKPGMAQEKTTQAAKGVFGKFKKEDPKVKVARPANVAASTARVRAPPAKVPSYGRVANCRSDVPAQYQAVQYYSDSRRPHSKAALPFWKPSQDKALHKMGHQDYHNSSGDMSHVLDPPLTVETALYTNKAHKIASKFVRTEDVTYAPFRGVPPARNDEAFYDKNLNFLGKIDRPPSVNIKKPKWTKIGDTFDQPYKRFQADYPAGVYPEPADFHSAMSGEFDIAHKLKAVDRCHYSKCHRGPHRRRPRQDHGLNY